MADTRTIPALTDEEIDAIAARIGSLSLHATRLHELGGITRTIFDPPGLIEFAHELERAILARSTVRAPVDAKPDLHAAIMNLPCVLPDNLCGFENESERESYMAGHRDARHAAAELVSASVAEPVPVRMPSDDEISDAFDVRWEDHEPYPKWMDRMHAVIRKAFAVNGMKVGAAPAAGGGKQ